MSDYTCPVCGGHLIGDDYSSPSHCENVDVPFDVEADSGPYYCPETLEEEWYKNMPLEPTGNGIMYGDNDDIPF